MKYKGRTYFGTKPVLRFCLSALLLAFTSTSICCAQNNVIFIICDDLNDSVEGMGGHPDAQTPQIDRLMQAGVRFTNAHCNAPICGPSRASLWTGLLPSTTGYYGYDQQTNDWRNFPLMANAITMMEHFKDNGYNVWGSGKIFHNGHADNSVFTIDPDLDLASAPPDFGPFPWDGETVQFESNVGFQHPDMPTSDWGYWSSMASLDNAPGNTPGYENYQWSLKDGPFFYSREGGELGIEGDVRDRMPDEISAQWAEEKLGQTSNKPFFMVVGMNRPHAPFYAPKEFFDFFRDENGNNIVTLPPYDENDLIDIPEIAIGRPYGPITRRGYQNGIDKYKRDYGNGANEWWLNFVQGYLACVAFVDHQVGVIWDALQESQYADDTIVILTSDHGYHLGEKNHASKTTPWEETTRVPLIIFTPEMRPGGSLASVAGLECRAPVSLIDLYPTLNALCGMPSDPNGGVDKSNIALDGNDLSPLLEAPHTGQWGGPSISLSHLHNARIDWPADTKSSWALNHHAVRSDNYRYILYSDASEELYDHSSDSEEWTNEALNEDHEIEKLSLKRKMFQSLGFSNSNNMVANGNFENDLSNWVMAGSASATLDTTRTLNGNSSALVTSIGSLTNTVIMDYDFDDADGTQLDSTEQSNGTSDDGSWNRGQFRTQTPNFGNQNGIGALNVGYTQFYKSQIVDDNSGTGSATPATREYSLRSVMSTGQFDFVVDFADWDLRRNWDENSNSQGGKGVEFSLIGDDVLNLRFETTGATSFRARATLGSSTGSVYGTNFDNSLGRRSASGGLLRISGDLDSGSWTAYANDGEGGDYITVASGSGLTSISGIRFDTLSPSDGSWGGAGAGTTNDPTIAGNSGDYMRIDSITLTSAAITVGNSGLKQDLSASIEEGKRYNFSAWVRSDSSSTVQLNIIETSQSDVSTQVTIGSVAANDFEFLLIEGDYTAPNDLEDIYLIAQGTDFYLDHVQAYKYKDPNILASVILNSGADTSILTWNAELASSYKIQKSLDLESWTDLETLTAYESVMLKPVRLDDGEYKAFWRVVSID